MATKKKAKKKLKGKKKQKKVLGSTHKIASVAEDREHGKSRSGSVGTQTDDLGHKGPENDRAEDDHTDPPPQTVDHEAEETRKFQDKGTVVYREAASSTALDIGDGGTQPENLETPEPVEIEVPVAADLEEDDFPF